ncbi:MAG: ABC transporter substrate-binding protein [Firmicutes bacterium]|nr:ABC transporter substrate-binding protein [Bacillota bacterium]
MKTLYRKRAALLGVLSATILTGGLLSAGTSVADAASTSSIVKIPIPGMSSFDPTQFGPQILLDQGTIMEGLAGYSPSGKIVPKIAQKWVPSEGGKVWTIYLRHDAKWSNGQPVTAQDFYYSWMRMDAPQDSTGAFFASIMPYVLNGNNYHDGIVPASAVGLQVVNPYELKITLTAPHDIVDELPIASSMPLYPPVVKAYPNTWFLPSHFVGDAPYVVTAYTANGSITLKRNPHYVGAPGEVNVGNVPQIEVVPTPSVPLEDYMSNSLSSAIITSQSDYAYVQSHPVLKAQLHVAPQVQVNYLQWDKSVDPSPLDNVLVRKAIAMAINRAPLVNPVLSGMGGVTTTFGFPGWPVTPYEHGLNYNVAQARALLAKAGYPGGKGIPTLHLYCQTAAVSQASVSIAEAIQQELKTALGINFTIDPTASTLWGAINWGGLNQGILPGYNVAVGNANFMDSSTLSLDSNYMINLPGAIGPHSYMQHISNWYFPTYDPSDVKQFGNPADPKMGLTFAEWAPLQKAALADIQYLNKWLAHQPAAYRALLTPAPGQSNMELWNGLIKQWHEAKTAAQEHQAWVNAWKFIGNSSGGNGTADVGLSGQVYIDEHEPKSLALAQMWNVEGENAVKTSVAVQDTAKVVNFLMQQGYQVPLYYNEMFYLVKPGLTHVSLNPWAWGDNYWQLQYITMK